MTTGVKTYVHRRFKHAFVREWQSDIVQKGFDSGSIHTKGGIGADKDIVSGGYMKTRTGIHVYANTDSGHYSQGSIVTEGGMGVKGHLYNQGGIEVTNTQQAYLYSTSSSAGSIHSDGGIAGGRESE